MIKIPVVGSFVRRDKHAQKCLQDLRCTTKNCIVVKLKMHITESCCQEADTSTMLGILLPTGDISDFFFLKFHEPLSQTEALERSQRETMPADFTNISLSGMYIIKGRFLDECIDTLKYFSYNNQTTMLFLHGTLLYLHRASLSGELSYTCLQYCFVGIYTKEKIMLTSNEKQLPFFLV